jgi:lactoylglutathione lyase
MNNEKNKFRLLHTMIRVSDLDKSIDFYTRHLGMKLLRRTDYEVDRFTLAFVGYGDEHGSAVIELTHNWDQAKPYDHGNGFGHLAIAVPDAAAVCKAMEMEGVNVPRGAGPMKGGTRIIAFVDDPDGYKIELVQRD